jgi:hypothetical protein
MEDEFLKTEKVGTLIKLSALAENIMVPTKNTTHGLQVLNFCHEGSNRNEDDKLQIKEANSNVNIF